MLTDRDIERLAAREAALIFAVKWSRLNDIYDAKETVEISGEFLNFLSAASASGERALKLAIKYSRGAGELPEEIVARARLFEAALRGPAAGVSEHATGVVVHLSAVAGETTRLSQ